MMNDAPRSGRQALVEIALIFVVFFILGAWPVPDVNEPYYVGKAIHYWNPDWLRGDFFMQSADTHKVFYFTFGWLSLWLSPIALIWTGRILTWLLLAWSWRRLSVAVAPRRWYSVLTAALFVCLMERCHMAGEWVIGGVEAKGFAYVFVFLGLEAFVRNRWNLTLVMLGAASAFHVLVGGWTAVAVGIAWLWLHLRSPFGRGAGGEGLSYSPLLSPLSSLPSATSLWPGILGGMLLALPGVWPSLMLDWGVDAQITRQAHQIYVFERLPHHLVLSGIRPEFIFRLAVLWGFWLLLGRWSRQSRLLGDGQECLSHEKSASRMRRLRAFVTGSVAITLIGVLIHALIYVDRRLAANLLRFYWFRVTDVALPLGVALEVAASVSGNWVTRPKASRYGLALAILVAAFHLGDRAIDRLAPLPPRSHRVADKSMLPSQQMADFQDWLSACQWVADPNNILFGARFLTPRLSQTFTWYTGHSDVATWKDVPQDAQKLVEWWERIEDIYATKKLPPEHRWYEPLSDAGAGRLRQLGVKYEADYAIAQATDPVLDLPVVYRNHTYIIYRVR